MLLKSKHRSARLRPSHHIPESSEQLAAHAVTVMADVHLGCGTGREHFRILENVERSDFRIEPDHVAVAYLADDAAIERFGRYVDCGGHLARRAGHAPVRDQRHLMPTILEDAEGRG